VETFPRVSGALSLTNNHAWANMLSPPSFKALKEDIVEAPRGRLLCSGRLLTADSAQRRAI
jgi:hypothetical protein